MRKVFWLFTAVALLAFFAVSIGGCGGSSSNPGRSPESSPESEEERSSVVGDLLLVYGNEKYYSMMEELEAEGVLDKMNPIKMFICITDDEAEEVITEILAEEKVKDETYEKILRYIVKSYMFDAEKLKESYEKEETILLAYPDETFINKALEAAGIIRGLNSGF